MNKFSDRAPVSKQLGHLKHIGMMAVCCGLPILLILGIGAYGISSQSLEFMILLICPIGLGIMMWMMVRTHKSPLEESGKSETVEDDQATKKPTLNA